MEFQNTWCLILGYSVILILILGYSVILIPTSKGKDDPHTVYSRHRYIEYTTGSTNLSNDDLHTVYSKHRYIEYTTGNTNLIISVPHDGFLQPASIPNRTDWTDWTDKPNNRDTFLQEIGRGLVAELTRVTGTRPYLVVNNLHRCKLDPNRDIKRAAHGNPGAEDAYNKYHQFIQQAEADFGGPGLLIDLHGHPHPTGKVEIGYNYKHKDIDAGDFTKDVSTMNALMARTCISPADLLAGDHSLGAMFEKEGYKTFPSPRQPGPGEDKYFRGGYTIRKHGSMDGGVVDALQIEVPKTIREGPQQGKDDFTKALAKVIAEFQKRYYTV